MNRSTLLVLTTLLALLPSSSDDVVVRVGGRDFTRGTYVTWLEERLGIDYVETWARELAALQLAEAEGQLPTDAEIDAAWERERARIVASFHNDDESSFLEDITARGYSFESFVRVRKQNLRAEIALEKVARARRVITDEQVRKRFDELYGADREVTEAHVLFYNMYVGIDPGTRPEPRELKARAKLRAEAALDAWRAGADFEQLQKDSDKIGSELVSRGFIANYRPNMLGVEVDAALNLIDRPGNISPPVEVWDGYVLIQLIGRREVAFEDERDAIRAELEAQPPTSAEISAVQSEATERAEIEILLR